MADEIDDGEFWLPSQFLTEEDILTDFGAPIPIAACFNSDLGSPVESVAETESDEDEFLAELTRRMARSCVAPTPKGLVLSGSPQSTLFPIGGGSSRGSPSGPVSPPPTSANGGYFKANDAAAFDLLIAAAGEVAKLRMRTEKQQKGTGYFDGNRPGFVYPPRKQTSPDFHGFLSHQHGFQSQLQLSQLWSIETMKHQQTISRAENRREEFFHCGRSNNHLQNHALDLSPSAWPPLQRAPPQNLSSPNLRSSSFGAPASKRESVGTGVFLPRRVVATTDSRSKIKNKPDSAGRIRGQGNGIHGPRRNSFNAHPETQLPSEWTY